MIDVVKNSQGEAFVDLLEGANMAVVNGRKGRDAFTWPGLFGGRLLYSWQGMY